MQYFFFNEFFSFSYSGTGLKMGLHSAIGVSYSKRLTQTVRAYNLCCQIMCGKCSKCEGGPRAPRFFTPNSKQLRKLISSVS